MDIAQGDIETLASSTERKQGVELLSKTLAVLRILQVLRVLQDLARSDTEVL